MISHRNRFCLGLWVLLAVGVSMASGANESAETAKSVDPAAWAKADLLEASSGEYVYDHSTECTMRDEEARPEERALARIRARAPRDAMSRDQLVALIQRMEAVFLMSIGQGFRPDATAMAMASILDCRPRPDPGRAPTRELILEVGISGFVATIVDHDAGTKSVHRETWVEAFRP